MNESKNPSVVEFSVLADVASCLWLNAIKSGRMTIAVFPLLNVVHVSAPAAEDNTSQIVLNYMWIG